MVSETESVEIILNAFPKLKKIWEKEMTGIWRKSDPCFSLMVEFSHYIKDMIVNDNIDNRVSINLAFNLAEKFLIEGNERVKDAVATCFLENLINAVAWGRIPASGFVNLLGEESKKYCKAWDEFTGVKTEGL